MSLARGSLATLLALVACGGEPRIDDKPVDRRSDAALETVAALRQAFRDQRSRPVIAPAPSMGLLEGERGVRAVIAGAPLTVTLPLDAGGAIEVRDGRSQVAVGVTLVGAAPGPLELADGLFVYRGGAPGGGHVVMRVDAHGVEDFVLLREPPPRPELRYRLDLAGVAGIRLVDSVLELLDGGGYPRLRAARPWLLDADGVRHRAELTLEGCIHDRSGAAPWHRAPIAPGSDRCELVVGWERGEPRYPVLIDPLWSATTVMVEPRWHHTSTLLDTNDVLIAGGCSEDPGGPAQPCATPLASAELFTGSPGGDVFSVATPMPTARSRHTATKLLDGRVLVAGGEDPLTPGAPRSSLADCGAQTCAWSLPNGQPSTAARRGHTSTLLPNGAVLVVGGQTANSTLTGAVDVFEQGSWVSNNGGSLLEPRAFHAAAAVQGGVAVFGGTRVNGTTTETGEVWRVGMPPAGTSPMSTPRIFHRATRLASGEVLVTGGTSCEIAEVETGSCESETLSSAELFLEDNLDGTNSALSAFVAVGNMALPRQLHSLTLLDNGWVLAAGGTFCNVGACSQFKSVELYDPMHQVWSKLDDDRMADARDGHAASALADGRVLVSGGRSGFPAGQVLGLAELYTPRKIGEECVLGGECHSSFCVDGVCCDGACDTACFACSTAEHGGDDGTCLPVDGADPRGLCLDQGQESCGATGECMQGTCLLYSDGVACAPAQCVGTDHVTYACNGQGVCTESESSDCGAFLCDPDAGCGASPCASATDCIDGALCLEGVCTIGCFDDDEVINDAGDREWCSGYACRGDACLQKCDQLGDCAGGYLCSRDHQCVLPSEARASPIDCGCTVPGRSTTGGALWVFVAATALLGARRRLAPPKKHT